MSGDGDEARIVPLRPASKGQGQGKGGGARCPICRKPAQPDHAPFCSARCTEIDLGRWLKGMYRVPTDEVPTDGASAEGPFSDEEER